jgi:Coenzyme PQQ synthesis protein D (PqqD)
LRLRANALAWHEVDSEVIAIDVDAAVYLAANGAGAVLWKELATGTTRDRLVAKLVEVYGIETQRSETDVDAFLRQLEEQGLLAA